MICLLETRRVPCALCETANAPLRRILLEGALLHSFTTHQHAKEGSVCECDHSLTIDFFFPTMGLGNPTSLPGRIAARDLIPVPRVQHRKAPPMHILAAEVCCVAPPPSHLRLNASAITPPPSWSLTVNSSSSPHPLCAGSAGGGDGTITGAARGGGGAFPRG